MIVGLLAGAISMVMAPVQAAAEVYDDITAPICAAAVRRRIERIAVLPFQGLPARPSQAGLIVSERLISRILRRGRPEVVERTLLESVISEQRLGLSGLIDPRSVRELGRVLGVDAVVIGTVLTLNDGRLEVNARMIDAQTAQILAAGSGRVAKDWSESMLDGGVGVAVPALPDFEPSWPDLGRLNDGLNSGDKCARARAGLERRERQLIDVKARFWALSLRSPGFSMRRLTRNPGSEIQDPSVRVEFYARLKGWSGRRSVPELSEEEGRSLSDQERRSRLFAESCREAL